MLLWFSAGDRAPQADAFATSFLQAYSGDSRIAPTIRHLLGIDPGALQAVAVEHTQALPLR